MNEDKSLILQDYIHNQAMIKKWCFKLCHKIVINALTSCIRS